MRKKLFIFLILLTCCISVQSQNWNLVWREDFGVVEDSVIKNFADPSMSVPNHEFAEDHWINDGYYGIANSTWWAFIRKKSYGMSWAYHFTPGGDHTRNPNGGMLIVNVKGAGNGEAIYQQTMKFDVCGKRNYRFTIFGACVSFSSANILLSNLTLNIVNIKDPENPVVIKSMDTGDLPLWSFNNANNSNPDGIYTHIQKEWKQFDLEFTASEGDVLKLQVLNNCIGGNGNDFVLDDISLYRLDEEVVEEPEIQIGYTYEGDPINSDCNIYTEYTIQNNVREAWGKLYDYPYFLWQQSEDDGFTWQNIPQGAGVDKTSVEVSSDGTKEMVFRLITTGGATAEEAQKEAEYIGAHGGPSNGCTYFAISSALFQLPEQSIDCENYPSLMTIWSHDFGTIDSTQTRDFDGVDNRFQRFDTLQSTPFNEGYHYAVTCAPNAALFNHTEENATRSHSANYPSNGASDKANDAFLIFNMPQSANTLLLIDKTLPAEKLCHCRQNLFNLGVKVIDAPAATASFTVAIEDEQSNTITTQQFDLGAATVFSPLSMPFALHSKEIKEAHLKVYCTTTGAAVVAFDDLSITSCGEFVPQVEVGIDGQKEKKYHGIYNYKSPSERHTVTLYSDEWLNTYKQAEFIWQKSTDGLHWTTLTEQTPTINHAPDAPGMTLYRAIVSSDKATTEEIAQNGFPRDPCQQYRISHPVTISCKAPDCEIPNYTIDEIPKKVCQGESVTLKANVELSSTNKTEWRRNGEILSTSDLSLTDIPTDTTIYEFIISDQSCEPEIHRDTVVVEQRINEITIDNIPTLVCRGDVIHMEATTPYDPEVHKIAWVKNRDTISIGQADITDSPTQATYYEFSIQGQACPTIKKGFNVNVQSTSDVSLDIDKDSICEGEMARINVIYEVSNTDHTIVWEKSSDNINFEEFDPSKDVKAIMPTSTTFYRIKAAANSTICPTQYSNTLQVNVESKANVTVTEVPPIICEGESVELNATAQLASHNRFEWSKNGEILSTTDLKLSDTPTDSTTYKLMVYGRRCPTIPKEFSVAVEKKSEVSLALSSQGVCEEEEVMLTANHNNAQGLEWQRRGEGEDDYTTFSNDLTEQKSIRAERNETFRVVTTGEQVCSPAFSEEVTLEVEPKISFEMKESIAICSYDQVEISVNFTGEPSSITWYEKAAESDDYKKLNINGTSFEVLPSTTTAYKMEYTAQYCPDSFGITTALVDDGVAIAEIPNDTICGGETIQLQTTCNNPSSLIWEAAEEEESSFSKIAEGTERLEISPNKSTTYRVSGSSVNGCPSKFVYTTVVVYEPLQVTMNSEKICEGDTVTLQLYNLTPYTSIKWSSSRDGYTASLGSKPSLKVSPATSSNYKATVYNGVCVDETEGNIEVFSYPKVFSYIEVGPTTFELDVESDHYPLYYDFGNGTITTSNILENPVQGMTYQITVSNEQGCSTEFTIEVPLYDITVPDYFVADRERWQVENLDRYNRSSYKIYDRFGKLIYVGTGEDEGWDGTYNGKTMPTTDYWYIINVPEIDRQFSGHFTLMRE